MEFERLIQFIKFTNLFQQTKRSIYAVGEDRMENDAEHSYQLALVAWYLNNTHNLMFRSELLLKYAIVHDLVEAYAGDTPNFGDKAEELKKDKQQREHDAMIKIKENFSWFSEMNLLIENYEKKQDAESVFIGVLDKLLGPLNIYLDNGRSFFKNNVTLQDIIENKSKKINNNPVIESYFKELVAIYKKEEHKLFPKR